MVNGVQVPARTGAATERKKTKTKVKWRGIGVFMVDGDDATLVIVRQFSMTAMIANSDR